MREYIFIAASWKQRDRVRKLANDIRELGHEVYDFTDPNCRKYKPIPPETFPEEYDPSIHLYKEYLNSYPDWKNAINENENAIDICTIAVLLLPCGIDATADWAVAVGKDKETYIIGSPNKGERHPVHLWADDIFRTDEDFLDFIKGI